MATASIHHGDGAAGRNALDVIQKEKKSDIPQTREGRLLTFGTVFLWKVWWDEKYQRFNSTRVGRGGTGALYG